MVGRSGPCTDWCIEAGPSLVPSLSSSSRPPVPGGRLLGVLGGITHAPVRVSRRWRAQVVVLTPLLPCRGLRLLPPEDDLFLSPCTPRIVDSEAVRQVAAGVHTCMGIYIAARERHGRSCYMIQERACSRAPCSSEIWGRRWSSLRPGAGSHISRLALSLSRSGRGAVLREPTGSPRLRAR